MQLTITTDYAIRIALLLSLSQRTISIPELSEKLHIPKSYVPRIITMLKKADIVDSSRGQHGGIYLKKSPEQITFKVIFDAVGETIKINRCLEEDKFCSRCATDDCPVRNFYTNLQDYLDKRFSETSIIGATQCDAI